MSNLPTFGAYAAAFEETLIDDNWSRLEQYFAEQAAYLPGDGTEAIGRRPAIQAMKDSVESLERNCDDRELIGDPEISETGDTITLKYKIKYSKKGLPDFFLNGTETIEFAGGVILRMEDVFEDVSALAHWRDQIKG